MISILDDMISADRLGERVTQAYRRLWRRKRTRKLLMLHQRAAR